MNTLTPREKSVAALMAQGKTNKEIAGALNLTPNSVKVYVGRVLSKTECGNRTLVALWYQKNSSEERHV